MTYPKQPLYVQYGAGNEAVEGWLNFDASPTLRIQKIPLIGRLLRPKLNCVFDAEIRYGDIVRGLPLEANSVRGLFASHVLEHLSYDDFLTALDNSYGYLQSGAIFRIIVPDLAAYISKYTNATGSSVLDARAEAAFDFLKSTGLGTQPSRSRFSTRIMQSFRSRHYWMWDQASLVKALINQGFIEVGSFQEGVCDDAMFLRPERKYQFSDAIAVQCVKP